MDTENIEIEGYKVPESLCLNIIKKGSLKANAFYRWSAFTETCADYAYNLVRYRNILIYPFNNLETYVVRMLSLTGAGFALEDMDEAEKETFIKAMVDINFPLTNGENDGIIEIFEKGMNKNEEEADITMTINYDKKIVDFSESFIPISYEQMEANGWIESDIVDMPIEFSNLKEIPFKLIPRFRKFVSYLANENKIVKLNDEILHSIY